jgi:hypothetical protein
MTTATKITDGTYFLHIDGGGWVAVQFRSGKLFDRTAESNAATHRSARDSWAGIVPSDDDAEIHEPLASAIVADVLGDEVDPYCVIVTRIAA